MYMHYTLYLAQYDLALYPCCWSKEKVTRLDFVSCACTHASLFLHICSPTSGVGPAPSMAPSGPPAVVAPDTAESTLTIIAANLSDMFAGMWLHVYATSGRRMVLAGYTCLLAWAEWCQ